MKNTLLALLSFLSLHQAAMAQPEKPKAVKWYPGHYVTLASAQEREKWQAIAGKKNFVGGQRIYTWRQLEPELGSGDFLPEP